jgi:hypothetical protein
VGDQMMRLITERRKRTVATIMGHAERELWHKLTVGEQQEFRRKVLQAIDEYTDLVRDVLKISGEDVVVNGHALELLQQIHDTSGQWRSG